MTERLMLNAYGRQCFDAGFTAAKNELARAMTESTTSLWERLQTFEQQLRTRARQNQQMAGTLADANVSYFGCRASAFTEDADALAAVLAALPEAPAAEWLPIETAPKDGSALLMMVAGRVPFVAWWVADKEVGGYAGWWRGDAGYRIYPTHWMPLPAPPAPPAAEPHDDVTRCALCGWKLVEDTERGCVRGNCSQRPLPQWFYAPLRAAREMQEDLTRFDRRAIFTAPAPPETTP